MVLPAPVWPTTAMVWLGSRAKETSRNTQSGSPGFEPETDGPQLLAFFREWNVAIGEPNVIELDASRAGDLLRFGGREDLGFRIEQLEDTLTRCHRRLQNVVLLAQVLNRAEKPLRVLHKRHQRADGRELVHHATVITWPPPNQITPAIAMEESNSTTG